MPQARRGICMVLLKRVTRGFRRLSKNRTKPILQQKRIDAIDFWRGVALAAILVNHIPGNALGVLTPRNFAFSDAAEIFVFLSGVSVYLAYGRAFAEGRAGAAAKALLKRAAKLYGAHLALTAAALAFFGLVTALTPLEQLLVEEGGRIEPYLDPLSGMIGLAALTHQVAFFNILPLYVLLIAAAPMMLFAAARCRLALLGASLAVYAGARAGGVNLPPWPGHNGWYFNPFAWQLMFALGILCGAALREEGLPYSWPAHKLAQLASLAAAAVVSDGFGFAPGLVDEAGPYLDWDKSNLGSVRILSFLALAYAVHFSGLTASLRETRLWGYFSRLGRNALTTFCFGSLLSAVGLTLRQALEANELASPAFDAVYVACALALLGRLARVLERGRPSAAESPAPGLVAAGKA